MLSVVSSSLRSTQVELREADSERESNIRFVRLQNNEPVQLGKLNEGDCGFIEEVHAKECRCAAEENAIGNSV